MSSSIVSPPEDALTPFRNHAVFQLVKTASEYLGIGPDLIVCMLILSMAAGRKRAPIHVKVISDQKEIDLAIVDRLGLIFSGAMDVVDTYAQYKSLERGGFQENAVLHVRREEGRLFEEVLTYRATTIDPDHDSPSVWKISGSAKEIIPGSVTLNLYSDNAGRKILRFVTDPQHHGQVAELQSMLSDQLLMLCHCEFGFEEKLTHLPLQLTQAGLLHRQILIVVRLLQVFTHLRRILSGFQDNRPVCLEDYLAVRALLQNLPLVPLDRTLSVNSLHLAERIYEEVTHETYQLALPDRSAEGHKWFTRSDAMKWADQRYTTTKKGLLELEDEGLIVSSVNSDHRKQGRKGFYRFRDIRNPPIAWRNPFDLLPETL